jgi:hypothetical protein
LEPKPITVEAQPLPTPSPRTSASIPTVDRWGIIARTYFTLAQLYCCFAAIRVLWLLGFAAVELRNSPATVEHWVALSVLIGLGILEFSFYGSLFFVFAFVKRKGLRA